MGLQRLASESAVSLMATLAWPGTYVKVILEHTPLLSCMCQPPRQLAIPDPGAYTLTVIHVPAIRQPTIPDPGAYTLTVIHVPAIKQLTIPDPGHDCHGVCCNDDAATVR